MSQYIKISLIIPVILMVCAVTVIGCGTATTTAPPAAGTAPAASAPATPTSGGTVRWAGMGSPSQAIGYPPEVLGPAGVTPQISMQCLLKEYLDGSVKGGLAESYETNTSKENPSITFHLRKNVKFHDGTDFNAQAVKWNLEEISKAPANAGTVANWKGIDVIDDYTIRVNYKAWQNSAIRSWGDSWGYMISPTAFKNKGLEWVRWNMVGTGPFMQKSFTKDVNMVGVRNPNYWEKGKPYLDGMEYLFTADEMSTVALLKTDGCEVINVNSAQYAQELAAAGYEIFAQYLGPMHLWPDGANADSPWSNVKVRMAAEYAIDKEGIAKSLGFGYWRAAYQFSTPVSIAFDTSIPGRKYDVAKAKQLMTEAGYPNGFKTTIVAAPLFLNKDSVLAIQNMLGEIGIKCDLQFPDMPKWSEMASAPWKNGIYMGSVNEWGNQATTFYYFIGPRAALSAYRPPGWLDMLEQARVTPQQDPVLLKKIENLVYDNCMGIPLYSSSLTWAFNKKVRDHGAGTRGQANWYEPQNMWIKK